MINCLSELQLSQPGLIFLKYSRIIMMFWENFKIKGSVPNVLSALELLTWYSSKINDAASKAIFFFRCGVMKFFFCPLKSVLLLVRIGIFTTATDSLLDECFFLVLQKLMFFLWKKEFFHTKHKTNKCYNWTKIQQFFLLRFCLLAPGPSIFP